MSVQGGFMNSVFAERRRVRLDHLQDIGGMPLLLDVSASTIDALRWADEARDDVQYILKENGALLIRGLKIPGSAQFGKLLSTLFGSALLEYTYRSTPRTGLRGNV